MKSLYGVRKVILYDITKFHVVNSCLKYLSVDFQNQ
jgi:hypothetical protein